MEQLKDQQLAQGVFGKLFQYYAERQLPEGATYGQFEDLACRFLVECGEEASFKEALLQAQFNFHEDEIEYPKAKKSLKRLIFLAGLRNFYIVVRNVINGDNPEDKDFKYSGFQRQASPPLSAYDYVGHNDPNIKKSSKSYSLLFNK